MKRRSFSNEQRSELIAKIDALISKGTPASKAIAAVGVPLSQYYKWKKAMPKAPAAEPKQDAKFVLEVPIPPHVLQAAVKQYLAQKLGLNDAQF